MNIERIIDNKLGDIIDAIDWVVLQSGDIPEELYKDIRAKVADLRSYNKSAHRVFKENSNIYFEDYESRGGSK